MRGTGYRPRYIAPPETARQQQLASSLAAAESPGQIAAGEALRVPAGHYSATYPPVRPVDTADELSFADAWVSELLDINFRSDSRSNLFAWSVAGEAANTLPGVPVSVADKALYASLADPNLGDIHGSSPVPSAATWTADAAAGVSQSVSGLEASVDSHWTSLVSEGFVPLDPLLSFIDVSGVLTTRHPPKRESSLRFSLVLVVGSALHHPGYGAIAVDGWTTR